MSGWIGTLLAMFQQLRWSLKVCTACTPTNVALSSLNMRATMLYCSDPAGWLLKLPYSGLNSIEQRNLSAIFSFRCS